MILVVRLRELHYINIINITATCASHILNHTRVSYYLSRLLSFKKFINGQVATVATVSFPFFNPHTLSNSKMHCSFVLYIALKVIFYKLKLLNQNRSLSNRLTSPKIFKGEKENKKRIFTAINAIETFFFR